MAAVSPLVPHEELMQSIRSHHKLRPTAHGQTRRLVETSRTRLDEADGPSLPPAKKVIKPNISFQLNSFSVRTLIAVTGVLLGSDRALMLLVSHYYLGVFAVSGQYLVHVCETICKSVIT